jgi:hypothetical protein
VTLSASISPSDATGTVTRPLAGGTATFTPVASQLQVPGSPHAIRAVYNGDVSYAGSLSSASNLTISVRTVQVTGTKTYDGGALEAGANLTAVNNVDGGSLTIGGTAVLSSKSVGSRTVVSSTYIAPSRVQSTTTNTATGTATSLAATLGGVPVSGNTLVAVIATRATTANTVTAITQAGATWRRATQPTGTSGTTEIWYAPNVQSAGTNLTLSFASTRLAAVIMEYSGVSDPSPAHFRVVAVHPGP